MSNPDYENVLLLAPDTPQGSVLDIQEADLVIQGETVIKDRFGQAPRPATTVELAFARAMAEDEDGGDDLEELGFLALRPGQTLGVQIDEDKFLRLDYAGDELVEIYVVHDRHGDPEHDVLVASVGPGALVWARPAGA